MRRRCEKRISASRVGGRPGVPEELLEFANRKNSLEFAMGLGRPVPFEQGAADIVISPGAPPTHFFKDLTFWYAFLIFLWMLFGYIFA